MSSEPWRCVYGEHGLGGGPLPDPSVWLLQEVQRRFQARNPHYQNAVERDAIVEALDEAVMWHASHLKMQRLEAAAQAGLFLHRHRTLGRAELEQWQTLTRAAGCGDQVVPPTEAGLAQVLAEALR